MKSLACQAFETIYKRIVFGIVVCLSYSSSYSQNILMPTSGTQNQTTCNGTFYDSGGSGANFSSGENGVITFCPSSATTKVKITFTSFNIGLTGQMKVYDGNSVAATLIDNSGVGSATSSSAFVGTIFESSAPGSCITFQFLSSGNDGSGWVATVSCYTPCVTPVATISFVGIADTLKICPGQVANFDGLASVAGAGFNIADYEWNLGDGTLTTGSVINHNYDTTGHNFLFYVELKVKDNNGCYSTNSERIEVKVSPNISFAGTKATDYEICLGETTDLIGIVTQQPGSQPPPPPVSGVTYLPDGNGSCYEPSITYTQFSNSATVTSAADILQVFASLEHTYLGDLSIDLICPNGQMTTLLDIPHTFCGNGTGPQFLGAPVTTDGTGPGTGWLYSWNNTAVPTIAATASGHAADWQLPAGAYAPEASFDSLIGCPLNGTWKLKVCDHAGSDDGYCFSFGLDFNNTLYQGQVKPIITSQNWMNDASIIVTNSNTVTVKPTTSGIKTYTYTASNDYGCSFDTVISIKVNPNPVISFTANPVCLGASTSFTNSSTIPAPDNIPAANWSWDYDNNGSVDNTTINPSTTFSTSGIHQIKLKATSNNNCRDSIITNIVVGVIPTATFNPIGACENATITLNNTSSISAPDNITGWAWDFGANSNPITSNLQNPNNLMYTVSGVKLISLTVTANTTCTATITKAITIYPTPVANFNFVNTCINAQPFNFDASLSNISIGTNTAYAWSYGDAAIGTGSTTSHSYASAQAYNVMLTVTSDQGCKNSITQQIEVYQKPIMAIVNSSACDTKAMTFTTAASLPNSGNVVNWFWDFNNNTSSIESNGQSTSYIFPSPGSQTVALISETDKGCRDTLKKNVYVDYVPKPLFDVDKPNGCPLPHCVVFTDNTAPITGPEVNSNWKWVLGDGTVINSLNNGSQAHCYNNTSSSQSALFNIKLIITTSKGCVDSLEKISLVTVYPKPIAQYSVNPNPSNVVTPLVYFNNESQDYTKWWWYFGDSPIRDSINVNPNHFYNSETANTYNSVLIVQNQYGCVDTAYATVEIGPEFTFYIPNAFTPDDEDNVNPVFTGKGIGIAKFEMWIYDRWGENISYIDDIAKGWDGKVQGKSKEAPQDVYVWKVQIKDVQGKKHDYVGHVTLLR